VRLQDLQPLLIGIVTISHDDVGREARLFLGTLQQLLIAPVLRSGAK